MTAMEKLKTRLGIALADTTKDVLLELLLEEASGAILDYTMRPTLPTAAESLQRDLAVAYYNRMGSEGEASRSEGGISVSWSTEIPAAIKARLNAFRRLKGAVIANASTE